LLQKIQPCSIHVPSIQFRDRILLRWVALFFGAPGNYIEFTLPDVPAGSYQFGLRYRGSNNRGQAGLQVDGAPLGSTLNQYRSSTACIWTNLGSILFAAKGSHIVRLTVTGKNASSSGHGLSADKIVLTPQQALRIIATRALPRPANCCGFISGTVKLLGLSFHLRSSKRGI
jgi:hypothetical protein